MGIEMQTLAATGIQARWRGYAAREIMSHEKQSLEESRIGEGRTPQQDQLWDDEGNQEAQKPLGEDQSWRGVKAVDPDTSVSRALATQERDPLSEDPTPVEATRAMNDAGTDGQHLVLVAEARSQDGYFSSALPEMGLMCDENLITSEDRVEQVSEIYYNGKATLIQKTWRRCQQRRRCPGQVERYDKEQGYVCNESFHEQTEVGAPNKRLTEEVIPFPGRCRNLSLTTKW